MNRSSFPDPGRDSDGHGHWLSFAAERTDGSSWFPVVPAEDPEAGPVARARIPVRVPLGLHGCRLLPAGSRQPTEAWARCQRSCGEPATPSG
ncbi:carotenoid oxygenase family protein [Streptomyces sp. NPDC090021]|uniref:carotenoid oxygenase family protein n=1 Tax=Streptomyces sp. NPDC090021 TaxID=3365919 RepID=UPI00380D40F1